jgi:predicted PolB exonuclease-like 3'-5' exonuclease
MKSYALLILSIDRHFSDIHYIPVTYSSVITKLKRFHDREIDVNKINSYDVEEQVIIKFLLEKGNLKGHALTSFGKNVDFPVVVDDHINISMPLN